MNLTIFRHKLVSDEVVSFSCFQEKRNDMDSVT